MYVWTMRSPIKAWVQKQDCHLANMNDYSACMKERGFDALGPWHPLEFMVAYEGVGLAYLPIYLAADST